MVGYQTKTDLFVFVLPFVVSSFFAARNNALLLGLGAIEGILRLLGRGFLGLAATSPFPLPLDVGLEVAADAVDDWREVVGREIDATLAGRKEALGGDTGSTELLRARPGALGADGVRNWKEDGGAASFAALKTALLLGLGAIVGAAVLATEIVSLRLCPGTPSKVFFCSPSEVFGLPFEEAGELVEDLMRNAGLGWSFASLNDAAFVIRGAIVGGAVLATEIVSERL